MEPIWLQSPKDTGCPWLTSLSELCILRCFSYRCWRIAKEPIYGWQAQKTLIVLSTMRKTKFAAISMNKAKFSPFFSSVVMGYILIDINCTMIEFNLADLIYLRAWKLCDTFSFCCYIKLLVDAFKKMLLIFFVYLQRSKCRWYAFKYFSW